MINVTNPVRLIITNPQYMTPRKYYARNNLYTLLIAKPLKIRRGGPNTRPLLSGRYCPPVTTGGRHSKAVVTGDDLGRPDHASLFVFYKAIEY
jgi:hypothetical protein